MQIKEQRISIIVIVGIIIVGMGGLIFSQTDINKEIKYVGINYRDPFASSIPEEKREAEKVTLPNLKLNGIVWGGSKPRAIINDTVVGKGEQIEGVEIVDIQKRGIVLMYKGGEFFMDRISGNIKAVYETSKE